MLNENIDVSYCPCSLVTYTKLIQIFLVLISYATIYTMFPVFSLVLDVDVSADRAVLYPELYKDLTKVGLD